MDKRKKRVESLIEALKSLMIVVLGCSAVWLVSAGEMQTWFTGRLQEELPQITQMQESVQQAEAASPLRMIGTIYSGDTLVRRCLQYDAAGVDGMFQQTAGLLMEALSSTEAPQSVSRAAWEQALSQAPGLCFDFRGEMPLSVLSGWLSVERGLPDVTVRRLVLTVWEDSAALYYQDLSDGTYYRCGTPVVSVSQLEMALAAMGGEDAYYAFEAEYASRMAPDTVLVAQSGTLPLYTTSNPVSGGRTALSQLMTELDFNLSACVFYSAADEEVARSGSDTIRLSQNGELDYHEGGNGSGQFPLLEIAGESEVFSAVESCRQLASTVMSGRSGQAKLYLTGVERQGSGWKISFDYHLNGVPVDLEQGAAAVFYTDGTCITAFTLRLRVYAAAEQYKPILPPVQAAAAMSALELEGRELDVFYPDHGEDVLTPTWTALS